MELPRVVRQYDVFLSFRGADTRKGIVSHLHTAFRAKGIGDIFKDDMTLEVGDSISEEIKEAIHNSKFAVLVISENYASSTWCLDELQMIMDLHKKKQLTAVPIFYNVDPSDVRHQRGTFALERYECSKVMLLFSSTKRAMATKIQKWREALREVAGTSGKDSSTCKDEATMVADIVGQISKQLFSMEPLDFGDIVGMKVHMERLNPLLSIESEDEVRMIGIWGMGGIGKTIIAKCLYEQYSRQFPHYCFIENVRIVAKNGLPYLQKKFLSNIRGKKQETLWCVEKGCSCIKSKLKDKIFLVLDDVDNVDQLHALARKTGWFGPGSRIIITTRDFGLLYSFGVTLLYHVSFLETDDAIQVFKQVAFEGGQAPSDLYHQFSIRASRLAQGLPSALDAFGSYLRRITWIEGWEKALAILETIPHQSIIDILQTSYHSLDEQEKAAFLHIACLFNGNSVQRVNALIDDGDIRTKALEAKSLIDISPDGCITMHVLIEQAAREIVRQESGSMSWRQRILWKAESIIYVLQMNTGTTTAEGVSLHMCDMLHTLSIEGNVLKAINNLKFFKAFTHLNDIESKLKFLPGTDMLPNTLRLLHWDSYPMTTLPTGYYPHCLVELNLPYSNLVRLWDGTLGLGQLRRLDVTGSKNLTEIPDLSRATLLKELIMKGCTGLERTPESIGSLSCLRELDLSNCDGLTNLQIHISEKTIFREPGVRRPRQIILRFPRAAKKKLSSLENLSIEGKIYIRLWHLRGNAEHLSCISEQQIPKAYMVIPKERLPFISSFYDLKSLSIKRFSYIENCTPFNCISFSGFPCLAELNLINLNIKRIPDDIGLLQSLEKLDLSGNDFRNLPTSMKNLSKLKYAKLSNCSQLETLPELTDLQTLKLTGCSNLESLLDLSHAAVQDVSRFRLLELELDNSKIVQPLSDQLSHFTNLIHLDLSNHDFEAIPESIRDLLSLGTLCLNNCKKLKSVEELPQSLNHLYAHGCNSLENINLSSNHSIKHLDLSHCFRLQQDEQLITRFLNDEYSHEISQRFVCLPGTEVPRFFDNQFHGTSTKISLPPIRFTSTVMGFAACIMISCERSFNLQFPSFSYEWNCEADEVIRINLKPNLNLSSENEEEETLPSHHLVIIHVPSSINTEKIEELRLESNLHLPEEFQFPLNEIRACGIRMIDDDYSN